MRTESIRMKIAKLPRRLLQAVGSGAQKFYRYPCPQDALTSGLIVTKHRKIFS